MRHLLCLNIFLLLSNNISGQQFSHAFGFGLSISLSPQKYSSGASFSFTYGVYRTPKKGEVNLMPAYQLSINGYLNGIGTKFSKNEFQLDIHNSLLLSTYTNQLKFGSVDIRKEYHFLDHTYLKSQTIIPLESSSSITISSNYILNLNGRHQLYGSLLGQIGKFRLQHYNDGGIIMGNLKIADDKDRWWTGGTFIEFGNDIPLDSIPLFQWTPRKVRFSFHKFTWDNQEGYQSANQNGLEFIPIPNDRQSDAQYNSGQYILSVFWGQYSLNFEANNKLKDLQDLLHQLGKLAKHPTIAPSYFSFQITRSQGSTLRDH